MKILKVGILKPEEKAWWDGLQLECPSCKTAIEIEEKDIKEGTVKIYSTRDFPASNCRSKVTVLCPTPKCNSVFGAERGGDGNFLNPR